MSGILTPLLMARPDFELMGNSRVDERRLATLSTEVDQMSSSLQAILQSNEGRKVRLAIWERGLAILDNSCERVLDPFMAHNLLKDHRLFNLAQLLRSANSTYLTILSRVHEGRLSRPEDDRTNLGPDVDRLRLFIQKIDEITITPIGSITGEESHPSDSGTSQDVIEREVERRVEMIRVGLLEGVTARMQSLEVEMRDSARAEIEAEASARKAAVEAIMREETRVDRDRVDTLDTLKKEGERMRRDLEEFKMDMTERLRLAAVDAKTAQSSATGRLDAVETEQKAETAKLKGEIEELKGELAVLRAKVSIDNLVGSVGTAYINPSATIDKDGVEALCRLVLSSDPFSTTIRRLLSLTIGHSLSLSVGCFTIEDNYKVEEIATACQVEEPLSALDAYDLSEWATDKEETFGQLIRETLRYQSCEADYGIVRAALTGGIEAGSDETRMSSAERESIKEALAEVQESITTQQQTALDKITQDRAATVYGISVATAEAIRMIEQRSLSELGRIETKADKLDLAMLNFDRLHAAEHGAGRIPPPSVQAGSPAVQIATAPSHPNADLATILPLLKRFLDTQQIPQSAYATVSAQEILFPSHLNSALPLPSASTSPSPSTHPSSAPAEIIQSTLSTATPTVVETRSGSLFVYIPTGPAW